VLEHPGTIKDPQRVKESWNSAYQGSGNAHKVAVLEEGMKYQAIGISPEQAQFLETRKFQINEIARNLPGAAAYARRPRKIFFQQY
jgi:HK97 family phage portal protein